MPMQPRPRADTSKFLFPSLRFCIGCPLGGLGPGSAVFVRRAVPANGWEAIVLLHSGGAGGAGPFAGRGIGSLHGYWAGDGELARAFNVFGVEGLEAHRKIDLALALGHAGAGGFHLAARGTRNGPITLVLGVG